MDEFSFRGILKLNFLFRMQVPAYDQFICEPPEDDQRTATATMKFFTKTFKFVSYFVFGGILIAGALASKVRH